MGEYEPEDSRVVTQSTHTAPGEPPRTGPREDAARREAQCEEGREQDVAADAGDPFITPTVAPRGESAAGDPAALRRDAERPLGKG